MLKKAAVIAIAVAVFVSCCCIPASAATISGNTYKDIFQYPTTGTCIQNFPNGGAYHDFGEVGLEWYYGYSGNEMYYCELPYWSNHYNQTLSRYYTIDFILKDPWTAEKNEVINLESVLSIIKASGTNYSCLYSYSVGYVYNYNGNTGVYRRLYNAGAIASYGGDYPFNVSAQVVEGQYIYAIRLELCQVQSYQNWVERGYLFGWLNDAFTIRHGDAENIAQDIKLGEILGAQEEANSLLEEMTTEQEKTNEKLDEIIAQPEQEKQEAGGTGNDAIDSLTSVIPADNDGVIAAMRDLSAAMSYTGTECKWKFPALYIPAIDGVTSRIDLTGEKEINFTEWIDAMPADVIEVVRIIATIALILYCFKELYNLIKYILTMKGGGGGNE